VRIAEDGGDGDGQDKELLRRGLPACKTQCENMEYGF
jgi:hypothetical protein